MALEQEIQTYEAKLDQLLAHEGKFVLIHGNEVADFFDTYADALQAGYERFQLNPFLVKQIQAVERIQFVACGYPAHFSVTPARNFSPRMIR